MPKLFCWSGRSLELVAGDLVHGQSVAVAINPWCAMDGAVPSVFACLLYSSGVAFCFALPRCPHWDLLHQDGFNNRVERVVCLLALEFCFAVDCTCKAVLGERHNDHGAAFQVVTDSAR